ncbi:MAG: bifunctional (p)ppGpp synthetase/guanosine-3',5'-bis(diphosphate) 3'-pyrophosphohydrolase [Clostridia bacterium]|nr:bifunctional (p)ppGpp synthetase/guanosine-3',5'-bis(diphosphate) 3'-pyrophosphohydrolase [Clostridia bacterium]
MIYTAMTAKAMRIAYNAHHGAVDKVGLPYIHHPLHLAEQMTDEDTTICALLHDVVEDTELTFDDLRAEGFSEAVLTALRLLTHEEGVPYLEYVAAIKDNPIARAVKLADLRHNTDETRMNAAPEPFSPEPTERLRAKYYPAIELLGEDTIPNYSA